MDPVPATPSTADTISDPIDSAAAARACEEEASAILWRSFASTAAATPAGADAAAAAAAPGTPSRRRLPTSLGEGTDGMQRNAATTTAAHTPVGNRGCPDYTAAAAGAPGEYVETARAGASIDCGLGGAAWWTVGGGGATQLPTQAAGPGSVGPAAAAGESPWAARAARAAPAIGVPTRRRPEADWGHVNYLQQPRDQASVRNSGFIPC